MRDSDVISLVSLLAIGFGLGGCGKSSPVPPEAGVSCTADVGLDAWVAPVGSSGVTVYGTTNAPSDVTVRAIFVATQSVPLTAFNFRSWSVAVPLPELEFLALGGLARIPVTAFTSEGCQQLGGAVEPKVPIDGGSAESDGPPSDSSAER
jgi:hypothetical protein